MFSNQLTDWFKTANISLITEAEVEYYRQNPDKIDEITKEGRSHRSILPIGFLIGFTLVFTSKVIGFYDPFGSELFLNETIVDMTFELGVAVWGGVMTTFILEVIENRERIANERYKAEILRRIQTSG
ncbi:MAG: hypothetical protein AAF629_24695 [Chloroflexota bacterium]